MDFGGDFSIFSPFGASFSPCRAEGHFLFFGPIFSHFWISARFPFYTRRPDSQILVDVLDSCSPVRGQGQRRRNLRHVDRGCLSKEAGGVVAWRVCVASGEHLKFCREVAGRRPKSLHGRHF